MIAPAASGVSSPTTSAGARRELGDAREPRVQDARLHAEAREPAGGALDLAAPVDVVVAVGDHRRADRDPQDEQPEITLGSRRHAARADSSTVARMADFGSRRRPRRRLRPVRGVQPQRRASASSRTRTRCSRWCVREHPMKREDDRRRGARPRRLRHRLHADRPQRRRVHRVQLRRGAAGAEGRRDVLVGRATPTSWARCSATRSSRWTSPSTTLYRGLVQQAFSRKAMETWERELVRGVVDEHIDAFIDRPTSTPTSCAS